MAKECAGPFFLLRWVIDDYDVKSEADNDRDFYRALQSREIEV